MLNSNVALVILTIVQFILIVLFFYSISQIKANAKLISRKDMSRCKKLDVYEKLNYISHLLLAIVMVVKTNHENNIRFFESQEFVWIIDVIIMGISTISFFLRIYKRR